MIAKMLTNNTLTLIIQGESKPRVLQVNNRTSDILNAVNAVNKATGEDQKQLLEEFLLLIAPIRWIAFKDTRFLLADDGKLYLKENQSTPIYGYLGKKIIEFIEEGYPVDYLIEFWKNCLANPRQEAVTELFQFLESNKIPITETGTFIAYKKVTRVGSNTDNSKFKGLKLDKQGNVRDTKGHFVGNPLREEYIDYLENRIEAEFVDTHSRSVKQSIGDIVSMDRELCDPDRENHCSTGFHFAGYEYAKSFGGNAFIYVEVNPMNVTAIPSDYNFQKGRCCEYKIVGMAEEAELEVKVF